MKSLIIAFGLLLTLSVSAQDTLTLDLCLDLVVENSPRLKDRQVLDEQGRLSIDNIKSGWYPSLMLNGKASYQSDVIEFNIDQPGIPFSFPQMPHEQFGLNLDIRQTIYDGGMSRQRQFYEKVATEAALQTVDVDLQALKEQVLNLYFSILIIQEKRKNIRLTIDNLTSREKMLLSALENGVVEESDLQVIRVEILKIEQIISEMDAAKQGALQMMSIYLGRELDAQTILEIPYIEIAESRDISRPELKWFDLQSNVIDAGKELSSVKRMPQFFAYGQAGLGKPGYNMLSDKIDSYYLVGAGVHWNIWDWNNTKREKQILETRKQMILHSKESFSMKLHAGMEKEIENLEHFKSTIALDDKMLKMRMDITANAASKLDNGIISATDYLQVLNEENRTRVSKSTHKLQLLKAIVNYNFLIGTL